MEVLSKPSTPVGLVLGKNGAFGERTAVENIGKVKVSYVELRSKQS